MLCADQTNDEQRQHRWCCLIYKDIASTLQCPLHSTSPPPPYKNQYSSGARWQLSVFHLNRVHPIASERVQCGKSSAIELNTRLGHNYARCGNSIAIERTTRLAHNYFQLGFGE